MPPLPAQPGTHSTCRNQQREDGEHVQGLLATTGHHLAGIDPSGAACLTRSGRGWVWAALPAGADTGFAAHSGGRAGKRVCWEPGLGLG